MEFRSWGKTPRLFRDIVITEKIDGTNSAIIIEQIFPNDVATNHFAEVGIDGAFYAVGAQSKNRLIFPGKTTDNYGFAAFVEANVVELVRLLGVGHHFGEWWGEGIQKRYSGGSSDVTSKRREFALFDTAKHAGGVKGDLYTLPTFGQFEDEAGRSVTVKSVPVLYEGDFSEQAIRDALDDLNRFGSVAAPFHPNPEGIVIYHAQSKQVYKVTRDNNDKGKWETLDGSVPTQD